MEKKLSSNLFMKYNTIIVLAMGIKVNKNGKHVFERDDLKTKYDITGDQEFRFKAVKKLYEGGARKFILVGGSVINAKSISKPDVMEDILVKEYYIPKSCLMKLVSENNTEGNAKAVKEYYSNCKITYSLGLLTNFYHLVRAMKDFSTIHNLRFIPIAAESVIYQNKNEFKKIRKFYEDTGFNLIIANTKGLNSEIKGISDKEFGNYKSGIS
jgi:hypothetical protein